MTSNHNEVIIGIQPDAIKCDSDDHHTVKIGFQKEIPIKASPAIVKYAKSQSCHDEKSGMGGRLKIFLEGKMVVEFSDRKEGEKRQWIPVSKKTYWPPPTSIASWNYDIPTPHSLASDDTSSVHSSSWHRETRYKQCSPRYIKHSSRDFYLKVPAGSRTKSIVQKLIAGRYGRRPFDPITFQENRKRHKSKKESLSEVIERLLQKLTKCKKIKDEIVSPRKRLLDKPRSNNVLVQKRTKPHNAFQAKMKEYDKKTSYSIDSILRKQEDKTVRARSVGTIEQQAGPSSVYSKRMPSPVVARRKQVSSPVPSSLQMPFVSASFDPTLHGYLLANQQELMRVISLQNTQVPVGFQYPYNVPLNAQFGMPSPYWPAFPAQTDVIQRPAPVNSPWQGSPQSTRRGTPEVNDLRESCLNKDSGEWRANSRNDLIKGDDKPLNLTKSSY
ncbi:uncharacterized protein LOC136028945 isoform X1 [Artemia franciscana]|uniref:uncharacterized protein LOC136028945 isoform X1 n=1 Tax=Artemia franciscana TaxID=6661 RepID=UPI0032DAB0EB